MEQYLDHQTQFIRFYSMLSKEVDKDVFMKSLQKLIVSLKTTIVQETRGVVQKSHFAILSSLYKLIAYTRDIYGGLGERELTYLMLFIWNYHFPVPTAQCLHKIVLPIENNPPFGSWRDIKHLCGTIRKHSEKGENDPFIDTCISLMNHQLDVDYRKWLSCNDEYTRKKDTVYAIPKPTPSGAGLSLVCKWIPRERSAYKWLFIRCAIQWTRTFSPQYFKSCQTKAQFDAALKKGSKEYRHVFTRLSKEWGVLETKQCSDTWDQINMTDVPMVAGMRQQQAMLNIGLSGKVRNKTMNSKKREICAEKFVLNRITNDAYKKYHKEKVNPIFLDMGNLIESALRAKHPEEIKRLENQWVHMKAQLPDMPYYMPILDTSMFYRSPKRFYQALGHACLLAVKSSNSILFFDSTVNYITISECNGTLRSILEIVKPIYYEHHIGKNFKAVSDRIIGSINDSQMTTESISELKCVLFTDACYEDVSRIMKLMKDRFDQEIFSTGNPIEEMKTSMPRFIFWLSGRLDTCFNEKELFEFETNKEITDSSNNYTTTPNPLIISGSTNYVWTRLSQVPQNLMKTIHPYDLIAYLVNQPRYNIFGDYFNTLLSNQKAECPV